MSSKEFRLLWVDIETTGLDPSKCYPLEIAMFMTDPKLNIVTESMLSYLVYPDTPNVVGVTDPVARMRISEFVKGMHTKSGLWEAREKNQHRFSPAQVDALCYSWIHQNKGERNLVLAGSGTHFEGAWLPVWFPLVNSQLHYRQVNLSMLKVLLDREDPKPAHRALADLKWSLNLLREFMKTYQQ